MFTIIKPLKSNGSKYLKNPMINMLLLFDKLSIQDLESKLQSCSSLKEMVSPAGRSKNQLPATRPAAGNEQRSSKSSVSPTVFRFLSNDGSIYSEAMPCVPTGYRFLSSCPWVQANIVFALDLQFLNRWREGCQNSLSTFSKIIHAGSKSA